MADAPPPAGDPVYVDNRPLLNVIAAEIVPAVSDHLDEDLLISERVDEEFEEFVKWFQRTKIDDVPEARRDEQQVRLAVRLREAGPSFGGTPFRVVELDDADLRRKAELGRTYRRLDEGERELIALCERYGGRILLDDRAGYEIAGELGLWAMGTLDLLVRMVQAGDMSLDDGEAALRIMRQAEWEKAPDGKLEEYVDQQRTTW